MSDRADEAFDLDEVAALIGLDEPLVLKFAEEFGWGVSSNAKFFGDLAVAERNLTIVLAVVAFPDFDK